MNPQDITAPAGVLTAQDAETPQDAVTRQDHPTPPRVATAQDVLTTQDVRHRVWVSPVGELTIVVNPAGRLTGVYLTGQKNWPAPDILGERDDTIGADVVRQLSEYFEGRRTEFDLELAPRGTAFQAQVWSALRGIGYGETTTYGELARLIGRPTASRAVGAATGRNPWSIIVPCHRLVGRNGALTGYAGGLPVKERLLALELSAREATERSAAPNNH